MTAHNQSTPAADGTRQRRRGGRGRGSRPTTAHQAPQQQPARVVEPATAPVVPDGQHDGGNGVPRG